MQAITLILEGDGAWPDLPEIKEAGKLTYLTDRDTNWSISMAALKEGMASGKTSLAIRIDKPDGEVVLVETSLTLMDNAIRALRIKYPV